MSQSILTNSKMGKIKTKTKNNNNKIKKKGIPKEISNKIDKYSVLQKKNKLNNGQNEQTVNILSILF